MYVCVCVAGCVMDVLQNLSCLISTTAASLRSNSVNLHYRAQSLQCCPEKRLIGNLICTQTYTPVVHKSSVYIHSLPKRMTAGGLLFFRWLSSKAPGESEVHSRDAVWTLARLTFMLPHQMPPATCMWSVCSLSLFLQLQTIFVWSSHILFTANNLGYKKGID